MSRKLRRDLLPFRIERTDESFGRLRTPPLVAEVIDRELPPPGSGHGYKPSHFVMPLVLMLHRGGRKLEDLPSALPASGHHQGFNPSTNVYPLELCPVTFHVIDPGRFHSN